ncbi:MAG: PAS domain S-box protein [Nitrospira sp.]
MPRSEPVTILVVNEQADEVKLVTMSLRGFFPDCRVEVVYSATEALQWLPRAEWDLVLIDERLALAHQPPLLTEIRQRLATTTLVLQTDRSDPTAAVNALQAGADFLLYKKSPAFLTELVLYARGAIEQHSLRSSFERTQIRYDRILETLADVLYELDAEGRFVFVSPSVTPLLGYAPEELVGAPFARLVPPDQFKRARHQINDRRTGARASRRVAIELLSNPSHPSGRPARIEAEVSAKGLYDVRRRFTGSLGIIRDVTERRAQAEKIERLEARLQETDRLLSMATRFSALAQDLQTPLASVLTQSQHVLRILRDAQLDARLESLTLHATEAAQRGEALVQAAQESAPAVVSLNKLIDQAVAAITPSLLEAQLIERHYAATVPPYTGARELVVAAIQATIVQALRQMAARGTLHRLDISTTALTSTGTPIEPTPGLFPAPIPHEIEIAVRELDTPASMDLTTLAPSFDLVQAYELAGRLKGRMEWIAPAGMGLSVRLWIPLEPESETASTVTPPTTPPVVPPLEPRSVAEAPTPIQAAPQATESLPSPGRTIPDRRLADRVSVHLPARVTVGSSTWDGNVIALSLTGATVVVAGPLPPVAADAAYLVFRTSAGILELHATVHERGAVPDEIGAVRDRTVLGFQFAALGDVEQKVLGSFIEAAQDRTLPITLDALLAQADLDHPEESAAELRGTDHREGIRVRVALPVRLEGTQDPAAKPLGLAVNFSRGGACLQAKTLPGAIGETVQLHFPYAQAQDHRRTHEPAAPDAVLAAQIVWAAPDPTTPSELRVSPMEPGQRFGVRFIRLPPFAEREVNRVVAQHIGSSIDLDSISGRSPIVSARRECRNARGQVIAVTDDHARHQISPNTPIVVLSPGFGRTQTDYVALSAYLALNRIRVLRYDHSNHVGQSDGDVLQTTMRSMQADLQTVLEFAHLTWPTASIAVLAEDVSARVALKAATQVPAIRLLLLTDPVLDVQSALLAEHHHDLLADYQHGLRRGSGNVWGLNVNLDQFLSDLLAGQYASLATSVADWAALSAPVVVLTTPHTEPPGRSSFPQVDSVLHALPTAPTTAPLASILATGPAALEARQLTSFKAVFVQLSHVLFSGESLPSLQAPADRDLLRQYRLELERIRIRHHVSQSSREALWVAHVAQLTQLGNVHDYTWLLQELYQQALPLEEGATVLNLGCGTGDFARTLEMNLAYRQAHMPPVLHRPLHYLGLDRSTEALSAADLSLQMLARELRTTFASPRETPSALTAEWIRSDWETQLPCTDSSIDRIVASLSLSFVASPLATLCHAVRALTQDGRLILACLQPHTDLTKLYRTHLQTSGLDELSSTPQVLLHYLGRLHEAIRHGLLHSFSREQLAALLRHAGAEPVRIVPILDGQLLLATARKGN